jgi:hypothetical protein
MSRYPSVKKSHRASKLIKKSGLFSAPWQNASVAIVIKANHEKQWHFKQITKKQPKVVK